MSTSPRKIMSSLFEVIAVIGVIRASEHVYISRNIRSSLVEVIAVIGLKVYSYLNEIKLYNFKTKKVAHKQMAQAKIYVGYMAKI